MGFTLSVKSSFINGQQNLCLKLAVFSNWTIFTNWATVKSLQKIPVLQRGDTAASNIVSMTWLPSKNVIALALKYLAKSVVVTYLNIIHSLLLDNLLDHGDGTLDKWPDGIIVVDVVSVPDHLEQDVSGKAGQHLNCHLRLQIWKFSLLRHIQFWFLSSGEIQNSQKKIVVCLFATVWVSIVGIKRGYSGGLNTEHSEPNGIDEKCF